MAEQRPRSSRTPGPEPERAGPSPTVIGVVAGILVFLLVILGAVLLSGRDETPQPVATGTLSPSPLSPTPTTAPTASPTATPTPPTATPTAPATEPTGPREPTDADAAAFANSYRPPDGDQVESVAVDVNADGRKEVVFASISQDLVRIDVAAWNGEAYEVVFIGQGGGAEQIVEFTVTDYTGDELREIVTRQRVGADGESLSVWGWDGQAYGPQTARGGCWDGSHTYGITGASISTGEIRATCDDSPLPIAAWTTDIYTWDVADQAWTFEEKETP